MIWIAYAASWLATAAAVIYARHATGSIAPLWALFIPTFVTYSRKPRAEKQEAHDGQ